MTLRAMPAPHQNVKGEVVWWRADHEVAHVCSVHYQGAAADLLAAGVATEYMIAPGRHGLTRFDADGDRFLRDKRRTVRGGEIVETYKILRYKPLARAKLLPCAALWAEMDGREQAEQDRHTQEWQEKAEQVVATDWLDRTTALTEKVYGGTRVDKQRTVGRFQRPARWTTVGKIVTVDWVAVRVAIGLSKSAP